MIIEIRESSDCELTQLECAIKEVREIVGGGDCWIEVTENRLHFIDDYGNVVAYVLFK